MNEVVAGGGGSLLSKIRQNWVWYLILGALLMMTGGFAAGYAMSVTKIAMVWFGVILLVSGVFHVFYAFSTKIISSMLVNGFVALLCFFLGIYIVAFPAEASVFFTLLVGVFLVSSGILRILYSFAAREAGIWLLIIFMGFISIMLGTLILMNWPSSGLWIIGLYISVEIFLSGLNMCVFAIAARTQTSNSW